MTAHIRKSDGAEQSLAEHCKAVGELCAREAERVGLSALGKLIGIMHDMGKATASFAEYLRWSVMNEGEPRGIYHHDHAPTGAIFAYSRWYTSAESSAERLTAQMLALCIYAHHTGLMDCLDESGNSPFFDKLHQDKSALCYEEATANYLAEVCSADELDVLFEEAVKQVRAAAPKLTLKGCETACGDGHSEFQLGMLTRLLLSILVDADRLDGEGALYTLENGAVVLKEGH